VSRSPFTSVRTEGSLLPADLLGRLVEAKDLPGVEPSTYHLAPGESVRQAASRAWEYLTGVWTAFRAELSRHAGPTTGLSRERWLLILFRELDFGRLPVTAAGGLVAGEKAFPVSHVWEHVPIHLLGWGVDLDRRTPSLAGAAGAAPQAMVQELLNRTNAHLWAVLSNGQRLRLLRDSTSLVGSAYVEFDLEAMFDGDLFSDFALLYLLCHQSRFEAQDAEVGPASCWLERWRTVAIEQGTRALDQLRDGVAEAIIVLGTGFLQHPANAVLRERLAGGGLRLEDYQRSLLRAVYRLLFWFVAEDRDALHAPGADTVARQRYAAYFSSARLRELARVRRGNRHGDLWQAVRLVFDGLGREDGRAELGLPGIGGLFDHGPLDSPLDRVELANEALLTAVRSLSVVRGKAGGPRRAVDFRNLGAEELGSVYESLLDLHPRHDPVTSLFSLATVAGSERKTTGSYYTPRPLVECLLDTALDPLLDEACSADDPVSALLSLTVCDPACGSGHFLVAAARRIAKRVAALETDEAEPTPEAVRSAMRRVVSRCIHGVDVNPMATELAKVSLWMDALESGKPLSFLDANIRIGNSLLGVTPKLLAEGMPDAAFAPIEGDDKKIAAALKKRNRAEHAGQDDLFSHAGIPVANVSLARSVSQVVTAPITSLADVHAQEARFRGIVDSPQRRHAKLQADAWCAAFVQPKTAETFDTAITQTVLQQLADDLDAVDATISQRVEDLAREYRFFHWHLEFPQIFTVTEGASAHADERTGWSGGFSAMVGNPPWERVKLQEQEFFAARDEDIAKAKNAAARKKLIATLDETNSTLAAEWAAAKRQAEGTSHLLRDSGRYPLCGVGDVNTYAVFAEHFRTVIAPAGRMGIITPTGLATDATTSAFFADTLRAGRLAAFYDFENEAKIFPGVHNQFRFAVTCMTGGQRVDEVLFAFYTRYLADVPGRRYALAPEEVLLLNPNTGTLPLFRARIDAEITLGIYRRRPVLIRDGDERGNSWALRFGTLFHMANDSGLFHTADDLSAEGAGFDGWAWTKGPQRWLPLYEAKLLAHYDHRYSTYADATEAQLNKGTLPRLTDQQHDDPETEPLARYWLSDSDVADAIGDRWDRDWLLGWRDIARASDARTFVPCVLPRAAVGHVFPLALPVHPDHAPLLQAVWSSLACDYVVRQKLSGTHLTYGVLGQLACPAQSTFERPQPWSGRVPLREWVLPRVLELFYTSWRIRPYAVDLGEDGPPFRWLPERRELLRAELDAAMFHVYGLTRPEVEHVLDSFFVVRKYEERDHGEFRTKRLILEICDAMAKAIETDEPYQTVLDPPPGQGPRHAAG
jgi:hypothetical protein